MANKSVITSEIAEQIKVMASQGLNARQISLKIKTARDTVKSFCIKSNIDLVHRISVKTISTEIDFKLNHSNFKTMKEVQQHYKIGYDSARHLCQKYATLLIRDRATAAQDKILTIEEINSRLPDNSSYIDYHNGLYNFICSVTGRTFSKTTGKIFQGSPYGKSGRKLSESDWVVRLASIGYTLEAGTFTGVSYPCTVYCPKLHQRDLTRADLVFQNACPTCSNTGVSKEESEIMTWVRQYYPSATKYKFHNTQGRKKEIDIFIPELNLGIEYCGLYWHSTEGISETAQVIESALNAEEAKHYNKMLMAQDDGIELITIWDSEWKSKKEQILSFLRAKLKLNRIKLNARSCHLKHLNHEEAMAFFKANHIQGFESNSSIYIGLTHGEDTVAAMSLGNHPRRSTDPSFIYLNRFAVKSDHSVRGAASKLLKAAKQLALALGKTHIISWSDNRWTNGSIYSILGFTFDNQRKRPDRSRGLRDGSIWPDKHFIHKGQVVSANYVKRNNLQGCRVIYDCGKKRWVLPLV